MIRHDVINNHFKITIKLNSIIAFQPVSKLLFLLLLPNLAIVELRLITKFPSTLNITQKISASLRTSTIL